MPSLRADGDARFAESFLLQLAPIEAAQRGIASHGVHRGFAPQEPQQRVALLGELRRVAADRRSSIRSESAPHSWPRPSHRRSGGIAEEDLRGQRGDGAHAGMCHQPARLRPLARLRTDLLIEFVDVRRQMLDVAPAIPTGGAAACGASGKAASVAWPARLHSAARRRSPCASARPCSAFFTRVRIRTH